MNYDGYLATHPPGTVLDNYSGECVSNIANYLDYNGLHGSIAYANAKDWANHPAMQGEFNWVANNPNDYNQVPKRGDIIIWSGALPGSGGYGHIAIFDRVVSAGVFSSYDNNWGGRYLHFVTHNWGYVVGWWTKKVNAPAPAPAQGEEMITDANQARLAYRLLRGDTPASDAEINGTAGKRTWVGFATDATAEVNAREQATKDRQTQITNLTNLNNQLNQTITEITSNSNATKADKDAALAQIADLQAQLTTAMDKLKEAQTAPVIPPQETISETRFKQFVKWFKELLNIKE